MRAPEMRPTHPRLILFGLTLILLLPAQAFAGTWNGLNERSSNGTSLVTLPGSGGSGGIASLILDPSDWYDYRVRITHDDAIFPSVGWTSDNFPPTANDIQVCNVTGCEVAEIDAGVEALDWSATAKITVYLEAKSCLLCTWNSFEMTYLP